VPPRKPLIFWISLAEKEVVMFTESDLRELLDFSPSNPILSLYLNTEPSEGNADAYKLRMRSLLKEVNLPQDVSAVEHYFTHEFNWAGRAVAVFSCSAQNFFRAFPLAIPVRDYVSVADRPSVTPLANLLDNYGGYGVVLLDKQGARLFSFHIGELREQEGIFGKVVKHTKRGGASSFPGRRGGIAGRTDHMEEIIDRNMKEVADFAVHFFEMHPIRRILLGGTDENVALFRVLLPKAWQSLVMGEFPMSMTASHTEVLHRTMEIGLLAERHREEHLIEEMIDLDAKGGNAVTGLERTLVTVSQDRVQILVVAEGFHRSGYHCLGCHTLSLQREASCKLCGEKIVKVRDVVELAISRVMRSGATVEVVQTTPVMEKIGLIGARLRY
jgi:peptide chain release factor subunit 1